MTNQLTLLDVPRARPSLAFNPKEYKVQCLRECPWPADLLCDTPERAAEYWRANVVNHPYYSPDLECGVAVSLNTRRKIVGHHLFATGTIDTLLVDTRAVFRPACVMNAAAIILMHSHPSGDPSPSEGDIKVTRDLTRGGQIMKIEVLDHVIMGLPTPDRLKDWVSLRELGYFL